ncbi:MAG: SEC-C domain-containing protein [Planctomycetes bacterium]|nr:SEC-C domain-containing protein [Planctomycetota bacterium]
MRNHASLSDDELLALLRTEEDRLPRDAAQEILNRLDRVEEALVALLGSDAAWRDLGPAWWAPLHATRILAVSARPSAFEAVVGAIRRGYAEKRDWIILEAAAHLAAFGAACAGRLELLASSPAEMEVLRGDALDALALLALGGVTPEEGVLRLAATLVRKKGIDPDDPASLGTSAGFVLAHGIATGREKAVLAALGLDRRSARREFAAVWILADQEEAGAENAFGSGSLMDWYAPEAVARRVARGGSPRSLDALVKRELRPAEEEASRIEEELGVRRPSKAGRNDPCPCGSGKKFKKCCEGKDPPAPDPRLDLSRGRPVDDGMRDIRELFKLGLVKSSEDLNRLVVGKTADQIHAFVMQHQPPPSPIPRVEQPEPEGTGHFDIEVSLRDIAPRIWRRFLISDSATFLDLHAAIQASGGWSDEHLFAFRTADGNALAAGDPRGDDDPAADRVLLRDVLAPAAPTDLLYEYDFGDGWQIDLRCHGLVRDAGTIQRRLTGGARAFPAEDCGGVGGYEDCMAACEAKKPNADQRERLEWLGNWRPERFELGGAKRKFDRAGR